MIEHIRIKVRNKTIDLTLEEARELYNELGSIVSVANSIPWTLPVTFGDGDRTYNPIGSPSCGHPDFYGMPTTVGKVTMTAGDLS